MLMSIWTEVAFLPYFLLFLVLELFLYAKPVNWKSLALNWSYWPFWVLFNAAILVAMQTLGLPALREWAQHYRLVLDLGQVHPVVLALINLFLFDLGYYWFHRLQHTRWLWDQHAVHHSDTELNSSTAFRHHFLENLVRFPIVDLPLMFLFVGAATNPEISWIEAVALAFVNHLGIFAHANLRVGLGPINWLVTSPQTHRLHHSCERKHWNCNFAAYFPFIDVVFGTYMAPQRGEYPNTGIASLGRQMTTPSELMAYPFRTWTRRVRSKKIFAS